MYTFELYDVRHVSRREDLRGTSSEFGFLTKRVQNADRLTMLLLCPFVVVPLGNPIVPIIPPDKLPTCTSCFQPSLLAPFSSSFKIVL